MLRILHSLIFYRAGYDDDALAYTSSYVIGPVVLFT